jgi:hypothetical protein
MCIGEAKVFLDHVIKVCGGMEIELHLLFTWHWIEVSSQLHALATLPMGKVPSVPIE